MENPTNKITAFIFKDNEGIYTIYLKDDGGPIINNRDLSTAKELFEEALEASTVLKHLKKALATGVYDLEPELVYEHRNL